jgi:hypothetical protein
MIMAHPMEIFGRFNISTPSREEERNYKNKK